MNKLRISIFLVSGIVALFSLGAENLPPPAEVDRADSIAIDAVMERLGASFKAGDLSYQYEAMFTPILDIIGGKTQVLALVKPYEEQIRKAPIAFISWKAIKPYQYVSGKSHKYAIVRYESVALMSGKKLKKTSYELGIKRKDSTWQFVSGDNLKAETYEELFSDFPKDAQLPPVERILEKPDAPGVKQTLATYKAGETKFEQFKKDAGLVTQQFSEVTNLPSSFQTQTPDFYMAGKTSAWRIYSQHKNVGVSFGKTNDQSTFVVGDADGAISTLTFDRGTLSKMEPTK
jgi:hypothetical protein